MFAIYRAWAKAGLFNLTPGNVVDYQCVREKLRELREVYKIEQLSIDRKFQGQQLESELLDDGFNVTPAGQNGYNAAGSATATLGAPRTVRASMQVDLL